MVEKVCTRRSRARNRPGPDTNQAPVRESSLLFYSDNAGEPMSFTVPESVFSGTVAVADDYSIPIVATDPDGLTAQVMLQLEVLDGGGAMLMSSSSEPVQGFSAAARFDQASRAFSANSDKKDNQPVQAMAVLVETAKVTAKTSLKAPLSASSDTTVMSMLGLLYEQ